MSNITLDNSPNDLGLSTRVKNALAHNEINTIGDLLKMRINGLLRWPFIGEKTIAELQVKLKENGFELEQLTAAGVVSQLGISWIKGSCRITNTLDELGVTTFDDLCKLTPRLLIKQPNFGMTSLMTLMSAMHERGLRLSHDN